MPHLITLNQDDDTPARREYIGSAALTYLYDRSRDSQRAGARGQDFIAFWGDAQRLAFAVCDGVSQSFYGDLAARFLGEKLVAWLAESPFPADQDAFCAALSAQLAAWQPEAEALVMAHPLRPDLPPMLRDALLRKRENGSESMFLAVLVDQAVGSFAACWMGDLRLRLFDGTGEEMPLPNAHWEMRQRWSSRVGAKNGAPQVLIMPLAGIARLMAHSDGFGSRADMLKRFTLESLNALADELLSLPTSDDLALLDVALHGAPSALIPLETPIPQRIEGEPALRWQPVAGATWYRVWLQGEGRAFTVDVNADQPPSFTLKLHGTYTCRLQALSSERAPSPLSEPIRLEAAPLPEPAMAHPSEPTRLKPVVVKQTPPERVSAPPPKPPMPIPSATAPAQPFAWDFVTLIAALIAIGLAAVWYFVYMR